jgi:hypothetical protein
MVVTDSNFTNYNEVNLFLDYYLYLLLQYLFVDYFSYDSKKYKKYKYIRYKRLKLSHQIQFQGLNQHYTILYQQFNNLNNNKFNINH